jgi:hypothetical protein
MEFVVTWKGFACFHGCFTDACEYIRHHWISPEAAAERGVVILPATRYHLLLK